MSTQLENNTRTLAKILDITPEKAHDMIGEFTERLKTTPEMAVARITQALFAQLHLQLNDWSEALAILALPEPTFDQVNWETTNKDMTYAWLGVQAAKNGTCLEKGPSAAANWYHLCRNPQEVFALHFQIGYTHLAVWRLAHMWEEQ